MKDESIRSSSFALTAYADSTVRTGSIVLGGDLCPFGRVEDEMKVGAVGAVFHDLLPLFAGADFTLVNLECPLVGSSSPILKAGPAYRADPRCVNGLKNAHIHAVNLANNHVMDHGARGLRLTLDTCEAAGIACVGAGRNRAEAGRLLIREISGLRVAVLGMAEREFSIAGEDAWGAQPLDLIDFCRIVRAAQGGYDRLIVLLHGGAELYPYPSPRLQKTCRFLVEQGAHAVVCQHSHCAGACETYLGAPIVYGQGNLIHDIAGMPPLWYTGFLVRLRADQSTPCFGLELLPFQQSRDCPGVQLLTGDEEIGFRRQVDERSAILQLPEELERLWRQFCASQRPMYFSYLRGHGRLGRRLNRRVKFAEWMFSREDLLVLLDLFRCDTHREALESILECAGSSRFGRSLCDPAEPGKCPPGGQ